MAKILNCTCHSEFQDMTYGAGKRVFNQMGKVGLSYRCTVCGRVEKASVSVVKPTENKKVKNRK